MLYHFVDREVCALECATKQACGVPICEITETLDCVTEIDLTHVTCQHVSRPCKE